MLLLIISSPNLTRNGETRENLGEILVIEGKGEMESL
jgi:hypothetical protein